MQNLPTTVDVQGATLPQKYEQARAALAECHRVDECKDWADKAAALASYAKQADDDELYKLARRIQGRAVRRAGELLKTFQTGPKGGRPSVNGVGTGPVSQRDAAEEAGMSKRQEKAAVRVANIPEADFNEAVESADPPSVTALAERGKAAATREKPAGFTQATHFHGSIRRLAEFCAETSPKLVASGTEAWEGEKVRKQIDTVQGWLQEFTEHLEEKENGVE